MQMFGRTGTPYGAVYRYGFNGKENDDDIKGIGLQQDYGMRIYDPRLGRFLSVDPIATQYPELTPYQFASNTPIWAIDIDGMESGLWFSGIGGNLNSAEKYSKGLQKIPDDANKWLNSPIANKNLGRTYEIKFGYSPGTITVNKELLAAMFRTYAEAKEGSRPGNLKIPSAPLHMDFPEGLPNSRPKTFEIDFTSPKVVVPKDETTSMTSSLAKAANNNSSEVAKSNKADKVKTLQANKDNSILSEEIVFERLSKNLGENEEILRKPRIYIGQTGDEYSVPDFAIYNTATRRIVRLIEAKDGNAKLSPDQEKLDKQGGRFKGSSRAKTLPAQDIPKGGLDVERTNVNQNR
jgi:RHS repeat-associated protein